MLVVLLLPRRSDKLYRPKQEDVRKKALMFMRLSPRDTSRPHQYVWKKRSITYVTTQINLTEILEVDIKDPRYDLRLIPSTQNIETKLLIEKRKYSNIK